SASAWALRCCLVSFAMAAIRRYWKWAGRAQGAALCGLFGGFRQFAGVVGAVNARKRSRLVVAVIGKFAGPLALRIGGGRLLLENSIVLDDSGGGRERVAQDRRNPRAV